MVSWKFKVNGIFKFSHMRFCTNYQKLKEVEEDGGGENNEIVYDGGDGEGVTESIN